MGKSGDRKEPRDSKHRDKSSKEHKHKKKSQEDSREDASANGDARAAKKAVEGYHDRPIATEPEAPFAESPSESGDDSDDEDEDETGELVTDRIDQGIDEVLRAIRSGDPALTDKSHNFFPEIGAEGTAEARDRQRETKPVYLKDYQRERVLSGVAASDADNMDDDRTVSVPETYHEQQARAKADILKEIHGDSEEEDGDDDFLTKRAGPERDIGEVELPNPDADADAFLNEFLSKKAWMPSKKDAAVPTYKEVVEEDDSDEFDDLSEKFESAYNFRFEDPNAAEIVSYARDQSTLRRGALSSRQKKREKERLAREKEMEQEKLELAKLRKQKVNKVAEHMAKLQEALGEGDENVAELLANENLDADWDNDEWDKRMQRLFDDEFYSRKVVDAPQEGQGEEDGADYGDYDDTEQAHPYTGETEANYDAEYATQKKLSRKDLKRKAEEFVDENQDLLVDEAKIKPKGGGFKYREVEPEAFGLTSRDILLASDKELNQYAGLKKLASYRDKAKMEHDRKRFSKRKRLRMWRKEVFGDESEPSDSLWEKAKAEIAAQAASAEPPKPRHKAKKRKHSHGRH